MRPLAIAALAFLCLFLVPFSLCLAQEEPKGNTSQPYPVIDDGIKLTFDQIDKQYLGRKCSVFYKPGQPAIMIIGIPLEGFRVSRGNRIIVCGELYGLCKHQVNIMWFSPSTNKLGSAEVMIREDVIDYVMVEKR